MASSMVGARGDEEAVLEVLRPDAPLSRLRGVGDKIAALMSREAGIHDIRDLVLWFPHRHREVLELEGPGDAALGRWVRIPVVVGGVSLGWLPGRRSIVTVRTTARDGGALQVRFFNQPYLKRAYPTGGAWLAQGVLDRSGAHYLLKQGRLLRAQEEPAGGCLLAYPEVPGMSEQRLTGLIAQALDRVDLEAWEPAPLPAGMAAEFPPFAAAIRAMHRPASVEEHEAARRRFAVAEAVELFRRVERRRRTRLARRGPAVVVDTTRERRILAQLPFALTADQAGALQKVWRLMQGPAPMGLLLQGDVGTGKTAVAVGAALAAIAAGRQVAFLAPTELLAEQHHEAVARWLAPHGIAVDLLTARAADRTAVEARLRDGRPGLVFGTHALFSARTGFGELGLVVIDEQHRFGVAQRTELVRKGDRPHVLYMTATPIPRTLTLTLFGDLDVAVLRQRPPGHRPVPAFFVEPRRWGRVLGAIRRRVARRQRVYVVCPKIGEDGGKGGAVRLHGELSREFSCGLVHGQLECGARQAVLAAFRAGDIDVLVGTTVLEVGVDVPAATLMVIVGADRFGLATLHQLRGRVGRGHRRGVCVLTGVPGPRSQAVCRTTDGFALAEVDLELRGAGELLGSRQSGASDLRALDPVRDLELLSRVRDFVREE